MFSASRVLQQSSQKLSVMSWNVNGIRSFLKHDKDGAVLRDLLAKRNVDVLCLQETKLQNSHVPEVDLQLKANFDIHRSYWSCSTARKGYSGTAILLLNNNQYFSTDETEVVTYGIREPDGDVEGRAITLQTEKFSLVNTYVPNSGAELARLAYRTETWDACMADHVLSLRKARPHVPVLLVGDLNVAHTGLDYHNPHEPRTKLQAGTTPQEQASYAKHFLTECGMQDTFRALHPSVRRYSYFSARLGERGKRDQLGMRLDYVLHAAGAGGSAGSAGGGEPGGGGGARGSRVVEAYIEDEIRALVCALCVCGVLCCQH
jgi:exodeoxyribonuclease III